MDFSRCMNCQKLRWKSSARNGIHCKRCGSRHMRPVCHLSPLERLWVVQAYVREFVAENRWYDWMNPIHFVRAVWIGLHPQPLEGIFVR